MEDVKKTYTHKPWELGPLPDHNRITGIQCAFVDNGATKKTTKTGRQGTAIRFKMIVEIYTASPAMLDKRLPAFKRAVELRSANQFIKHIDKQVKDGVIADHYRDYLADMIMGMPLDDREKCMFGQIRENNNGWSYHPYQYVMFDQTVEDDPCLHVVSPTGTYKVTRFNDHFATAPIQLTAYLDVDDQLKKYKEKNG